MKVFIGADHRGAALKEKIGKLLCRQGYHVTDLGVDTQSQSCDYPKIAYKVAVRVARTRNSRGILVCMSGIGQAIAANKVPGAYAALCYNPQAVELSRRHNNANVLVLSAKFVRSSQLAPLIKTWMKAPFERGRHLRRFLQIKRIERGLVP